jgi:hypothetical protein
MEKGPKRLSGEGDPQLQMAAFDPTHACFRATPSRAERTSLPSLLPAGVQQIVWGLTIPLLLAIGAYSIFNPITMVNTDPCFDWRFLDNAGIT